LFFADFFTHTPSTMQQVTVMFVFLSFGCSANAMLKKSRERVLNAQFSVEVSESGEGEAYPSNVRIPRNAPAVRRANAMRSAGVPEMSTNLETPVKPVSGGFRRIGRRQVAPLAVAGLLAGALNSASPALALGPQDQNIGLTIKSYEEVECPEALAQGRAGGALGAGAGGGGIAQKCVEVKATADNGLGKTVKDAGVFGVVYGEQDGMSVLGNGQDGKNDAGQFALIDSIPPGTSDVKFIFVAQQSDDCISTRRQRCPVQGTKPLVPIRFEKVKAIAYPGGDRYKLYDECEQNPFAEGC